MEATDLRIGNLVDYENTTHVVTGIDGATIKSEWLKARHDSYKDDISEHLGILITEEWLARFGLKKMIGYSKETSKNKYLEVAWNDKDKWYVMFRNTHIGSSTRYLDDYVCLRTDLKYIHELQNLYFAISGRELELIDSTEN